VTNVAKTAAQTTLGIFSTVAPFIFEPIDWAQSAVSIVGDILAGNFKSALFTGILTFAPGSARKEKELIEKGAEKCLAKIEKKGGTYKLIDPKTGKVMKTGRSKDLERRRKELERAQETKPYKFEIDKRTNIYEQQRGREQIIHDRYKPALDKINAISPKNPNRKIFLKEAEKLGY